MSNFFGTNLGQQVREWEGAYLETFNEQSLSFFWLVLIFANCFVESSQTSRTSTPKSHPAK